MVLGHHRDDIIETFLLNLFHGGTLAAMPPKLRNDEGDLHVLRPLAHVAEADCARFATRDGLSDHPLRPLRQPGRAAARWRSSAWSTNGRRGAPAGGKSCSARSTRVKPSQLLDPALFDFAGRSERAPIRALTFRAGGC